MNKKHILEIYQEWGSCYQLPEERAAFLGEDHVLYEICDQKTFHAKVLHHTKPLEEYLETEPEVSSPASRGFLNSLKEKIANQETALIAEIKKSSPSAGVIRKNFNPIQHAKEYEEAGACCVSVLTDSLFFDGFDAYVSLVRENCSLPILRKEFILDPYQVVESYMIGADCVLLIMAILNDAEARLLQDTAYACGLDVLVEVHNEEELERALKLKNRLIGINNRNLKTLEVDTSTTLRLLPQIPDDFTVVCESGIGRREEIEKIQQAGVYAFLVGESIMRQEDVVLATKTLLGAA